MGVLGGFDKAAGCEQVAIVQQRQAHAQMQSGEAAANGFLLRRRDQRVRDAVSAMRGIDGEAAEIEPAFFLLP